MLRCGTLLRFVTSLLYYFLVCKMGLRGLPQWLSGKKKKKSACMQEMHETWVLSVSWEDPLEDKMAIQSSILAWRIP